MSRFRDAIHYLVRFSDPRRVLIGMEETCSTSPKPYGISGAWQFARSPWLEWIEKIAPSRLG